MPYEIGPYELRTHERQRDQIDRATREILGPSQIAMQPPVPCLIGQREGVPVTLLGRAHPRVETGGEALTLVEQGENPRVVQGSKVLQHAAVIEQDTGLGRPLLVRIVPEPEVVVPHQHPRVTDNHPQEHERRQQERADRHQYAKHVTWSTSAEVHAWTAEAAYP